VLGLKRGRGTIGRSGGLLSLPSQRSRFSILIFPFLAAFRFCLSFFVDRWHYPELDLVPLEQIKGHSVHPPVEIDSGVNTKFLRPWPQTFVLGAAVCSWLTRALSARQYLATSSLSSAN